MKNWSAKKITATTLSVLALIAIALGFVFAFTGNTDEEVTQEPPQQAPADPTVDPDPNQDMDDPVEDALNGGVLMTGVEMWGDEYDVEVFTTLDEDEDNYYVDVSLRIGEEYNGRVHAETRVDIQMTLNTNDFTVVIEDPNEPPSGDSAPTIPRLPDPEDVFLVFDWVEGAKIDSVSMTAKSHVWGTEYASPTPSNGNYLYSTVTLTNVAMDTAPTEAVTLHEFTTSALVDWTTADVDFYQEYWDGNDYIELYNDPADDDDLAKKAEYESALGQLLVDSYGMTDNSTTLEDVIWANAELNNMWAHSDIEETTIA